MKAINLLVEKGQPSRFKKLGLSLMVAGFLSLFVFLAVTINFYISYQINQLKIYKTKLGQQRVLLSAKISKRQEAQQAFKALEKLEKNLHNQQAQSVKLFSVSRYLKRAPTDFYINTSLYTPPCFSFEGLISSKRDFLHLVNSLEKEGSLKLSYKLQKRENNLLAFKLINCYK